MHTIMKQVTEMINIMMKFVGSEWFLSLGKGSLTYWGTRDCKNCDHKKLHECTIQSWSSHDKVAELFFSHYSTHVSGWYQHIPKKARTNVLTCAICHIISDFSICWKRWMWIFMYGLVSYRKQLKVMLIRGLELRSDLQLAKKWQYLLMISTCRSSMNGVIRLPMKLWDKWWKIKDFTSRTWKLD